MNDAMKILVLCGGASAERVVSLSSGDAVAGWLEQAGYDVRKFDPEFPDRVHAAGDKLAPSEIGLDAPLPRNDGQGNTAVMRGLLEVIDREKPGVIFPIFHGGYGENGTLQAVLDWLRIPYVGSGRLASSIAMNKAVACQLMRSAGVPVPKGFVVYRHDLGQAIPVTEKIAATIGFPMVIKPVSGGSTVGLTKVHDATEVAAALQTVAAQGDDALVEAHFSGRETTVTVVGGEAYPVIEIRPKEGFYDYSNKYTSGRTDYLCPAPLPDDVTKRLQQSAVTAFRTIGCEGFARIDFLVNDQSDYVCLEANTLPGMTTHSLVPKAARAHGEEPPVLMRKLVDLALKRKAESA
jgi:D-alanine-D-alanine ligase